MTTPQQEAVKRWFWMSFVLFPHSDVQYLGVGENLHEGVAAEEQLVGYTKGSGLQRLGPCALFTRPVDQSSSSVQNLPGGRIAASLVRSSPLLRC